jgi:SAM-dependent methyltransferase
MTVKLVPTPLRGAVSQTAGPTGGDKLLIVVTPTNDPTWLNKTWESLRAQDYKNWRWLVLVNHPSGNKAILEELERKTIAALDGFLADQVVVSVCTTPIGSIGQCKLEAVKRGEEFFGGGTPENDVFIEFDHDDLLLPGVFGKIAQEFEDPGIGFVYSDFIDFESTPSGMAPSGGTPSGGASSRVTGQGHLTYRNPQLRASWEANGWKFYTKKIDDLPLLGIMGGSYEVATAFEPSALALSLVYYAPNHVRAWRRSAYWNAGGHSPVYELCDDHELLCRTYLTTRMKHIPEPLYMYRVSDKNTWSKDTQKIKKFTYEIRQKYLERLILRECALAGLPAYDLGGGISPREGFVPVDVDLTGAGIRADLKGPWPFKDSSVGAFRAADLLEHLPDKIHTMREIWRCLKPGGWLLSLTPSTDGRGAFMDPTHKSYWNELSFWYWTRKTQARYIKNEHARFQEIELFTHFPSPWHKDFTISYVTANLVALKEGYEGPGEKRI